MTPVAAAVLATLATWLIGWTQPGWVQLAFAGALAALMERRGWRRGR